MVEKDKNQKTSDTSPSTIKTAFSCPFCGAYTTQYWYSVFVKRISDNGLPFIPRAEEVDEIDNMPEEHRKWFLSRVEKYQKGRVILGSNENKYVLDANNINLSMCYNCDELAVWIHDKLIFPSMRTGPSPNNDLPEEIKVDYEEARTILDLSPRGAAALLRLCIQKLCIHLGTTGDLNTAIGELKQRGLKQKVVDALDIVRVIGNEAVHPGTIDLNDNREIAESLFRLVNIITEEMISEDKHIDALFNQLPAGKRMQIEQRDKLKPKA